MNGNILFLYSQRIPLFLSKSNICFCNSRLKGHSHWQNVAKTKMAKDQEKAKKINEFAKKIKVAVKEGFDPAINKKLARVMEDYRKESLPSETFNKLLNRLKDEAKKEKEGETN
ncbi:hypothetical protein Mgra_00001722 [Meloidogyne graminicola]|uniref:TACO1/YebC-like N-terminal domain-containing protein n=1 Tax=Meloidogyne graminicola TaxID=189291 RepID=A0A8T0A049_9BILA|nr:hypothetical protein Mgra_00001722 [Meloidogyne graminicola]